MTTLLFILTLSATAAPNGALLGRSPCGAADHSFTCEKLTYSSDGLAVVAYLYHGTAAPDHKLPLIVFNRGGYVVKDQLPLLLPMFHRLATEGFAIIAPMYRGSDGAPGHDELGGADLVDLTNVVPLARGLGFIDLDNVFLYGESRGGVMTFLALRDGFPARAAATFGGFTDLGAYLQGDPRAAQVVEVVWPDFKEHKEQILASRSAIQWPDRIHTPLLLMHGGADRQVSPAQTLSLAARLEQLHKEYGVFIFAGDSHTLAKHDVERDRLAVRWFQEHMEPPFTN